MNATLILTAVLGGGAGTTIILGVVDRVRNRKFDKRKQDSTIQLDEATYTEIAARAETINNTNLMAVGAFWQGQFENLAKEFESEKDWRVRMTERLREHKQWDDELMRRLAHANIVDIEPPPSLDPDYKQR